MVGRGRNGPQSGPGGRGPRPVGMPPLPRGQMPPGGPQGMRPMGGGPMGPGGMGPGMPPNLIAALEQKLVGAQADVQKVLQENQRLAATHVALRQELNAAQQEVQRVQQAARVEAQQLAAATQQLQAANAEVQRTTQDLQRHAAQLNPLIQENQSLRQEVTQARTALEYERKANAEQLEQRQVLEKNLLEMARELEKLRAEHSVNEKRAGLVGNGMQGPGMPPGGVQAGVYSAYGIPQQGVVRSPVQGGHYGTAQAGWQGQQSQQASAYRPPAPRGTMADGSSAKASQAGNLGQAGTGYYQQGAGPDAGQQPYHPQDAAGDAYTQWGQQGASAQPVGDWQGSNAVQQQYAAAQGQAGASAGGQAYADVYGGQYKGQQAGPSKAAGAPPLPNEAPSVWTEHQAADGRVFYFNTVTGVTQWEMPEGHQSTTGTIFGQQQAGLAPQQTGKAHGPTYNGRQTTPQRPGVGAGKQAGEGATDSQTAPPGSNLFVFGLPDDADDRSLSQMFTGFGQVLYARVGVEKETGRSRGFGFVSMESAQAADKAIQAMNGKVVGGRRIKVERKRGDVDPASGNAPQSRAPQGPGPIRSHQGQDRRGYAPY